ncbi:MAG: hypothetical protein ACI4B9_07360 [Eggerthellaceae bacterium]
MAVAIFGDGFFRISVHTSNHHVHFGQITAANPSMSMILSLSDAFLSRESDSPNPPQHLEICYSERVESVYFNHYRG